MLNTVQIYKKRGDNARALAGEKAKSMQMLRNRAESNDATTLAGAEVATGIPTGALSAVEHDAKTEKKQKERRRVLNLLAEQEATAVLASQSLRAIWLMAAAPRATFQNHPAASRKVIVQTLIRTTPKSTFQESRNEQQQRPQNQNDQRLCEDGGASRSRDSATGDT